MARVTENSAIDALRWQDAERAFGYLHAER